MLRVWTWCIGSIIRWRLSRKCRRVLHVASTGENPQLIEVLLKAGAKAELKDGEGDTAEDLARANKKIYKTKVYWKLNEAQYE